MKIVLGLGAAGLAAVVVGLCCVALVVTAVGVGAISPSASAGAVTDIPIAALSLYEAAAAQCGMPWEVLAAVGKVESDHGRSNAAGVHSGSNSAGAEGPMQFLPATWATYGVDGNGDGSADVYDIADAISGAANYLCANGAGDLNRIRQALWNYNHDDNYVNEVLTTATSYESATYTTPVDPAAVPPGGFARPHHDYPAIDIPVPAGTPVVAVRGGHVRLVNDSVCGWGIVIAGTDGYTYTYCHASQIVVADGSDVPTGRQIAVSGGIPGAPGAGDATGPHLHFQIAVNGQNVCPQTLLVAWSAGVPTDPATAPRSGCTTS